MIYALITVGAILYVAGAFVAFGWWTLGGHDVMWRDYIWAAIWPLGWARPLYWKARHAVARQDMTRNGERFWRIFGIKAQRIDWWLMALGEEWSCRFNSWLEARR